MNNVKFSVFYKENGLRIQGDIASPPTQAMGDLLLPLNSLYHFNDGDEIGPDASHFTLAYNSRLTYLKPITDLVSTEHVARTLNVPYDSLVGKYHRANPRVKPLAQKPTSAIRDVQNLVIVSHNIPKMRYAYASGPYARLWNWENRSKTLWATVEAIAKESPLRHQFIQIEVPDVIGALSAFTKGEAGWSTSNFIKFPTDAHLTLLDIWKWIGENRASSTMSALTVDSFNKVNLLFTGKGYWSVVNLGVLNNWRTTPDQKGKETSVPMDEMELEDVKGLEPFAIQKRFLASMIEFAADAIAANEKSAKITLADRKKLAKLSEYNENKLHSDDDDEELSVDREIHQFDVDVNDPTGEPAIAGINRPVLMDDDAVEATLEVHERINKVKEAKVEIVESIDSKSPVDVLEGVPIDPSLFIEPSLTDTIGKRSRELVDIGMLSTVEYRKINELASRYKTLTIPDFDGTLEEYIQIPPELLKVEKPTKVRDIDTVVDKTMLESTLIDFDTRYIKDVLDRDVMAAIVAIQNSGVAVIDVNVEELRDVLNHTKKYTVKLVPVAGKPSTINFTLPVVHEDGSFMSGGVKYYLKKQWGDLPIRKISPTRVALTSYYGKLFIERSKYMTHNWSEWVCNRIGELGLNPDNKTITHLQSSAAFYNKIVLPKLYTAISNRFSGFVVTWSSFDRFGTIDFTGGFNYRLREKYFTPQELTEASNANMIPVGHTGKHLVVMDYNNHLHVMHNDKTTDLGPGLSIILKDESIDLSKAPEEIAVMSLYSVNIPMAMVFCYHLGLRGLLSMMGEKARRVPSGKQLNLQPGEIRVRFRDESLVFNPVSKANRLIIAGLNAYKATLVNYSVAEMDDATVITNILEDNGIVVRYVRELKLLLDMFIDPITRDILKEHSLPTTMMGLYNKAIEMLTNDQHEDETDKSMMRIKGYERFAGTVYKELVGACRARLSHASLTRSGIDVHPENIKMTILRDPSKEVMDEINPIKALKQKEVVTYSGHGGRSMRTMVKRTRGYSDNDRGVISEATVDSGGVGVITYLSANPNFNSLRGTTNRYEDNSGLTKLFSTSALISPGSLKDSPQRTNFINIQMAHVVGCEGYECLPYRTGYEQVIAHRCDDLYAYTAKEDGVVSKKTDKVIEVVYKSGVVKRIEIGRRFGKSTGYVIPHNIVTEMSEGHRFKAGDAIAFNDAYFTRDWTNPNELFWMQGIKTRVAFRNSLATFEDSTAISQSFSEKMVTRLTDPRPVVIDFNQRVFNLIKVGDQVEPESILCTIETASAQSSAIFDDESLDTLRKLNATSPRAKSFGVVEKIEVFYNGDIDEMDPTLQELAVTFDKKMNKLQRDLGNPTLTGLITDGCRIDGKPLGKKQMVINVYITSPQSAGEGDKLVLCNQMKSTIGQVLVGKNETVDGRPIDMYFSYTSTANRVVESAIIQATTNALLLEAIPAHVIATYRGKSS